MVRLIIRSLRNIRRKRFANKIRWLYLDLDSDIPERNPPKTPWLQRKLLGELIPEPPFTLESLHEDLEKFKKLKKLQGLVIHIRTVPSGLARLRSLRCYLEDFKTSGRQVIFHASHYSMLSYYLASVGSKILISPGGSVDINGFELAFSFFKDLIENNGFKFDAVPISPYKSAHEPLTRSDFSKEARENREWLLDSLFDTVINDVATALGKSSNEMTKIINEAPYNDQEALNKGLIHGIVNEDEIPSVLNESHQKTPKLHDWLKSRKKLPLEKKPSKKRVIAVISAEGTIIDGKSQKKPIKIPLPLLDDDEIGDQTINSLIRAATKDKKIKAVVLHINSRGGSASASESMWSAMRELVKKKPLVAYFSDVAASGGYYIAMNARWIVAQPTTITGSIGILSGKFVTKEGLKKRGINRVYLRRGERAGLWSDERPFSEEERTIVYTGIKHFYQLFLQRVADCRSMPIEKLEPICGGRVWTGKQALERQLVDQLGTIQDAIKKAAELAHLKPGSYRVINLHKSPTHVPELIQVRNENFILNLDSLKNQIKKLNTVKYWYIDPFKWEISE